MGPRKMLALTASKYGLRGRNWSDQVRICKPKGCVARLGAGNNVVSVKAICGEK
jgi:hypothetical protein